MRCRHLLVVAVMLVILSMLSLPLLADPSSGAAATDTADVPSAASPAAVLAATAPPLPGAADERSLGFGSSPALAETLLGKPTRVVTQEGKEYHFWGLSKLTFDQDKLTGWCTADRPLPMNIGAAVANSPAVAVGDAAARVVAAHGTPSTVAVSGPYQVWFYKEQTYTLLEGRVVKLGSDQREGAATGPAAGAARTLYVSELLAAFRRNPLAAEKQFANQRLAVTGPIAWIRKLDDGTPYLALSSGDEALAAPVVLCTFPVSRIGALMKLKEGQRVKVTGLWKGTTPKLGDPVLMDCTVGPPEPARVAPPEAWLPDGTVTYLSD